MQIEKRPKGSAIVQEVVAGSQAEQAGMKRGDILCFAGSSGQDEISYEMFLDMAKSDQRPMCLDIRRLDVKPVAGGSGGASGGGGKKGSAEAELRRQAVIAAAEKRDKANKAKQKPMKQVTKTTLEKERLKKLEAQGSSVDYDDEPKSEDAKKAAAAAKQDEAQLAAQLGYNPYEPARSTAGQARNATTAVQHGAMSSDTAGDHLPSVVPPTEPATAAVEKNSNRGVQGDDEDLEELPAEIEDAFTALVTTNENPETVKSACTIIKKLVVNATTKGQKPGDDAAKFRKVRLGNPKIQAAIVEVQGAVEFLIATGFSLEEQDGESHLIYPADCPGPDWLPIAMKHLDRQIA